MAVDDTDETIDTQLRGYFDERRARAVVPKFDAVMAKADADLRRREEQTWSHRVIQHLASTPLIGLWGAVAAVAALVFIYIPSDTQRSEQILGEHILASLPAELNMTQQELVANISRTTRWQAPSDQWLTVPAARDVLGLPKIGGPGTRGIDITEKNLWM